MGRSRAKKRRQLEESTSLKENTDANIIKNLPAKQLTMRVNSGTKMRNVLKFAMKEFEKFDCLLWTGAGGAVGKVISCAELFKRNHRNLHQVTKLRYIDSENQAKEEEKKRQVPEITICFTKHALDSSENGYQAPDDNGMFENPLENSTKCLARSNSKISNIVAEEFVQMGLRMGQKRSCGTNGGKEDSKKSKKNKKS